ncbi:phosphonate ABC transporter ATP-binding protein [Brevibacterium sp. ACRRH]|uniref:phosphonate ABC transporter ATP-binding protein n=1 Tax=Brevibacterium sp. ACRRH TaxID=2918183 RepID=UPI0025E36286|nr:phosphonate ABC transporter ATP-binding protein [uncultured Brevibacterium sp.]
MPRHSATHTASADHPRSESNSVLVRFDHVTKKWGDVTALDNVSVEFLPGEMNVLLGLSGSGKSTLLQHINGFQKPTSGSVQTLGVSVKDASRRCLRELRSSVGMIFQHFHLVGSMSVLENVCTGALASLRGPRLGLFSYPRAVKEDAMHRLARVGLADKAFQRADKLSGGQQQRVAIARSLIQQPTILLADEPVASLDPISSVEVMELLRGICEEYGITLVCSLHQIDLAKEYGDHIFGLNSGRIVMNENCSSISREDLLSVYQGSGAQRTRSN